MPSGKLTKRCREIDEYLGHGFRGERRGLVEYLLGEVERRAGHWVHTSWRPLRDSIARTHEDAEVGVGVLLDAVEHAWADSHLWSDEREHLRLVRTRAAWSRSDWDRFRRLTTPAAARAARKEISAAPDQRQRYELAARVVDSFELRYRPLFRVARLARNAPAQAHMDERRRQRRVREQSQRTLRIVVRLGDIANGRFRPGRGARRIPTGVDPIAEMVYQLEWRFGVSGHVATSITLDLLRWYHLDGFFRGETLSAEAIRKRRRRLGRLPASPRNCAR